MTRRQTKEIKAHPEKYKFMPSNQKFEYLPVGDKGNYPINFGVVRFAISENTYEVIITNLAEKEFPVEKIKEIFARLTMYNFCEIITTPVVIQQKDRKYSYQVNFTMAISICLHYFKCRNAASQPNVEALIQKNILPVRNGRKDPRKVRTKSAVSFVYRVA